MNARSRSYFELFGLPEAFRLSQVDLDDRHRRYQAAVHPDRHASGSAAERRLSLQLAADGNEAWRTLSEPTRRAAYLCERHGAPIDAERNTAMPEDFLSDQMAWREAIDELDGQPRQATLDLAARLGQTRDAVLERLARQIDDEHDYAAAARTVRQLMFFDKLHTDLRDRLRRATVR